VHEAPNVALDETSLVINGDAEILMGELNLWDIYRPVAAMREKAGYSSLSQP
jgi:hypothetical protein